MLFALILLHCLNDPSFKMINLLAHPQDALKCKTCPDKAASVCAFITMLIALYALGVVLGNKVMSEEEHSSVSQ